MFLSRNAANSTRRHLGRIIPSSPLYRQHDPHFYFPNPPKKQWLTGSARHPNMSPLRKKHLEQVSAKAGESDPEPFVIIPKTKVVGMGATALVAVGVTLYGLVFLNQYLSHRERDTIQKQYTQIYAEFGDPDHLTETYQDSPALFPCMVRLRSRVFSELGPLKVGDVVDILEEGVGKNQSLNICRTRPRNPQETPTICLYPMACLQRVALQE